MTLLFNSSEDVLILKLIKKNYKFDKRSSYYNIKTNNTKWIDLFLITFLMLQCSAIWN